MKRVFNVFIPAAGFVFYFRDVGDCKALLHGTYGEHPLELRQKTQSFINALDRWIDRLSIPRGSYLPAMRSSPETHGKSALEDIITRRLCEAVREELTATWNKLIKENPTDENTDTL